MRTPHKPGLMLELWRPPQGAGDPVGCIATTFTFAPSLFDEQCLGRFLDIEAEPNRENLAYLLERETRLGGVYAGVLVDHAHSGVEHSLRWDVLPVRVGRAKQHAKISLLAWATHIRIIVSSANLTEQGYRINHEVAVPVDLTPESANLDLLNDAIVFLRDLIGFVPGPPQGKAALRAQAFLDQIHSQTRPWKPSDKRSRVRQHLAFTLPAIGEKPPRSSLADAISVCQKHGGPPTKAWIASPFFDLSNGADMAMKKLCQRMKQEKKCQVHICVPVVSDDGPETVPRIYAPKALFMTARHYKKATKVGMLPTHDTEKNVRPWHAKMLGLFGDGYTSLMIGSSNFTCAGLGVTPYRNTEANIITIAKSVAYGREAAALIGVWPEIEWIEEPESAEWLEGRKEEDEDIEAQTLSVPSGFLSAHYRAGAHPAILLELNPQKLPTEWKIFGYGGNNPLLLSHLEWRAQGENSTLELPWPSQYSPEKILIQWDSKEAFLPINVEDCHALPPPHHLEHMTANDMLAILAAADPGAAFRIWARKRIPSLDSDGDLDESVPYDLDPLRLHDLQKTFLHRIRRRARVLAQLRINLERPAWGPRALQWKLTGFIGIEALADRLASEYTHEGIISDEGILVLADLLIVLNETQYKPCNGFLSLEDFESIFRPFLQSLSKKLTRRVKSQREHLSCDVQEFWNNVVEQCKMQ